MSERDPNQASLPGESMSPEAPEAGHDAGALGDEGAHKSKAAAEAAALAEAFLEQLRRGDAGMGETCEAAPEGAPDMGGAPEEAEHGRKKVKKVPAKLVMQLERRIAELEEKLGETAAEREKNYDARIRLQADFENYRRRAAKDKNDAIQYANEELLKELLPAVDNLERALGASTASTDAGAIFEGVKITLNQILHTLGKFGVEAFSSLGQPFDPQLHDAMTQLESAEHAPGHVASEYVKGYRYRDRLLRPAMVAVAKAGSKMEPKTGTVRVALGGPPPGAAPTGGDEPSGSSDGG